MLFTKFHLSHTCCVHVFWAIVCTIAPFLILTRTQMKMSWKRFENFQLIKTNFIVRWLLEWFRFRFLIYEHFQWSFWTDLSSIFGAFLVIETISNDEVDGKYGDAKC